MSEILSAEEVERQLLYTAHGYARQDAVERLRAHDAELRLEQDEAHAEIAAWTRQSAYWETRSANAEAEVEALRRDLQYETDSANHHMQRCGHLAEQVEDLRREHDDAIAGQVMLDDKLTLSQHEAKDAKAEVTRLVGERAELERTIATLREALSEIGRYVDHHGGDQFSRKVQDIAYAALSAPKEVDE